MYDHFKKLEKEKAMGIKKYIQAIFFMICFLLMSFAKPSAITANAIIENENDLQLIYSVIDNLFHTRLNAQVKMLFSDYTRIADFDNPMTQEWLNREERRDFTLIQIGKAYNYEYGSYKFNLEIERAYIGADQAEVELLENSTIEFLDTPNDQLVTYKLPHTIRLSRSSSGWLIYDDQYEDVINLTIGDLDKTAILSNIQNNLDAAHTDKNFFTNS